MYLPLLSSVAPLSPEEDFFWHRFTWVVPEKGPKTVVCVCTTAHSEAIWALSALNEEFASADNEGSIILWSVKDARDDDEILVEKRIAISGMGSVLTDFVVCSLKCISEYITFGASTLLVGRQEEHLACKK